MVGLNGGEKKKIDKEGYFNNFKLCNRESEKEKIIRIKNNLLECREKYSSDDIYKRENICVNSSDKLESKDSSFLINEEDKLSRNNSEVSFSLMRDTSDKEEETNRSKEGILNSQKNNKKLVNMAVLKNILNIYFLFDKNNEGCIDQKYACSVIEMIYKNNVNFILKNIKLNEKDVNEEDSKYDAKRYEGDNPFFCTKYFAHFLLLILKDVSVFQSKEGFIRKEIFIDIINEFVQTSSLNNDNDVFGVLRYPKNIVTNFYNYVYYLKRIDNEKKRRIIMDMKKNKELKNICFLDPKFVNADLNTHISYFKKKTKKKLEDIKTETSKEEMKECTFFPHTTKKPMYLLKKKKFKMTLNNSTTHKMRDTNSKYTPLRIIYDIDYSIERTLLLPNEETPEGFDTHSSNMSNNMHHIYNENNFAPIQLKYIIHQGYVKPKKISWHDTLRK
ncbi:conserved Plasmodium protein, unknown function [Plasmodium malariae]|nr:conserved Plasmodium protein, unknown function [Plasmodium malariae]SCO93348.1 conserved Plasmodium protein, unknown function [Plasmodium malariae]